MAQDEKRLFFRHFISTVLKELNISQQITFCSGIILRALLWMPFVFQFVRVSVRKWMLHLLAFKFVVHLVHPEL